MRNQSIKKDNFSSFNKNLVKNIVLLKIFFVNEENKRKYKSQENIGNINEKIFNSLLFKENNTNLIKPTNLNSKLPTTDSIVKKEETALVKNTINNNLIIANNFPNALLNKKRKKIKYHSKWKLYRVISGHNGWIRCIDVDETNNFFVTGSNDRVIKCWDLATGNLKISLTGHINTIMGLKISNRHPYLFSCGEDKMVKCWDLEHNKVVRHYHGHLSGVYSISLHPSLDLIVTGGRDCVARVWDLRSRKEIFCLEGHSNTVCSVVTQENSPQIITGSNDCTIKLWDIRNGKSFKTLTHHKKSIRSLLIPENNYSFISGGSDNIKEWSCPEGDFLRNIVKREDRSEILNSIALNEDGVLVSGGEDGKLCFFDYESGQCFQDIQVPVQPGSLECESGIFDIKFDKTSTRMITAGCDKTIKMWKEEDEEIV